MPEQITIRAYNGINTRVSPWRATQPVRDRNGWSDDVDFIAASNIHIDDRKLLETREGYSLFSAMSGGKSAYSVPEGILFLLRGVLCLFDPPTKAISPLLNIGGERVAYTTGAGRVFFTNGVVCGEYLRVAARLFGVTSVPFKATLPAGTTIAHHKARLYVGRGKELWVSDAKPLSRTDLRYGFKQFPEVIRVVASCADGLLVGTDTAVYYAPGGNPLKMPFTRIANYGAKEVPPQVLPAGDLGFDSKGLFTLIATDEGVLACGPNGQYKNLTEDRYVMPEGLRGTSLLRRTATTTQYITVIS